MSKTTSELIGIPRDADRLSVGGCWTMRDYSLPTNDPQSVEASMFSAKVQLYSNGTRTVALVTTGNNPRLDTWELIESDDPSVATFIEQMVAASWEDRS